jgi:hypothetical protein
LSSPPPRSRLSGFGAWAAAILALLVEAALLLLVLAVRGAGRVLRVLRNLARPINDLVRTVLLFALCLAALLAGLALVLEALGEAPAIANQLTDLLLRIEGATDWGFVAVGDMFIVIVVTLLLTLETTLAHATKLFAWLADRVMARFGGGDSPPLPSTNVRLWWVLLPAAIWALSVALVRIDAETGGIAR